MTAHATQTARLIDSIGPATNREWWRTESFLRAPAAAAQLHELAA